MSRGKGHLEPFIIAVFWIALDIALMAPLLVTLSREFGITFRWTAWVIALYLAVFSFSLPLAERWAWRINGRLLFSISLLLLVIGSIVGAIAPEWLLLLAGRTLQALGAGGVVSFLSQGLRQTRKPMLVRMTGGLLSGLLIVAPLLSVFLNRLWGWRGVFAAFLPLIFLLFLIGRRFSASFPSRLPRMELGSAFFFFGSVLFAMVAVTRMGPVAGWNEILHPTVFPFWILSLGLIVPLIMVEKRVDHPLFIPKPSDRIFISVQLAAAISGMCLIVAAIIPGWIASFFPDMPEMGGIGLAAAVAAIRGVLPLAGWLSDRWGSRIVLAVGFFSLSLASFILGVTRDYAELFSALFLLGAGIGLTLAAPLQDLLFGCLPLRRVRTGLLVLGMYRAAVGALGLLMITRLIDERNFQAVEALMMVSALSLAGAFLALRLPGCREDRERL